MPSPAMPGVPWFRHRLHHRLGARLPRQLRWRCLGRLLQPRSRRSNHPGKSPACSATSNSGRCILIAPASAPSSAFPRASSRARSRSMVLCNASRRAIFYCAILSRCARLALRASLSAFFVMLGSGSEAGPSADRADSQFGLLSYIFFYISFGSDVIASDTCFPRSWRPRRLSLL